MSCVRNNTDYITNLDGMNRITGYIATPSRQFGPGFKMYGAFHNLIAESSKGLWAMVNTTG